MNLTYEQLAEVIGKMTDEQKKATATVYFDGITEFYPVQALAFAVDDKIDALDEDHPYLIVRA